MIGFIGPGLFDKGTYGGVTGLVVVGILAGILVLGFSGSVTGVPDLGFSVELGLLVVGVVTVTTVGFADVLGVGGVTVTTTGATGFKGYVGLGVGVTVTTIDFTGVAGLVVGDVGLGLFDGSLVLFTAEVAGLVEGFGVVSPDLGSSLGYVVGLFDFGSSLG